MKQKFLWLGLLSLLISLLLFPLYGVKAQSLTPALENLTVALWPEYDQPEVLVIYRGQLHATTMLPAEVTFQLPGHIEDVHAVATEQDGRLINIDPATIRLDYQDDELWLTFLTPGSKFHFEYYDPLMLSQQGQNRQLSFDFSAPYDTNLTILEVQQPAGSEDFKLNLEPIETYTGADSLQYNIIQTANLAAHDNIALEASYQRQSTTGLSQDTTQDNTVSQPLSLPDISPSTATGADNLGYILMGLGVIVLLATAVYAGVTWYKNKPDSIESAPHQQRRAPRKKRGTNKGQATHRTAAKTSFCYQCGSKLRHDASFCHSCGAEKRI